MTKRNSDRGGDDGQPAKEFPTAVEWYHVLEDVFCVRLPEEKAARWKRYLANDERIPGATGDELIRVLRWKGRHVTREETAAAGKMSVEKLVRWVKDYRRMLFELEDRPEEDACGFCGGSGLMLFSAKWKEYPFTVEEYFLDDDDGCNNMSVPCFCSEGRVILGHTQKDRGCDAEILDKLRAKVKELIIERTGRLLATKDATGVPLTF